MAINVMIKDQFELKMNILDNEILKTYIEFCIENNEIDINDGEDHHIMPVSHFPEYKDFNVFPENKTRLTYINHLKAHYLLSLCVESEELLYAFNMMNNFYNKNNVANLEHYETLKKNFREMLKSSNWCKSSKGKRWMFKDGHYSFVKKDLIEQYLTEGWIFQGNHKDKIWVNNGKISKKVFEDDNEYKNWERGRLTTKSKGKTIWMNNGKVSTRIDKSLVEEYLKNGWNKGAINDSTREYKRINKDGKNTSVKIEELEEYLNDGWNLGAYKVVCNDCLKEVSSLGKQNHKCKGKEHEYTFNIK